MGILNKKNITDYKFGNAICYSGYREGQSPRDEIYPTYEQVKEDLKILAKNWTYIRLYDAGPQTETVLKVIKNEKLDLLVFLTANIRAEVNNPDCPWKAWYSDNELKQNKVHNANEIDKLIKLANANKDIIIATAAGNEATADFTDHAVPEEKIIEYVRKIKKNTEQPVSYCEGFYVWNNNIQKLAKEVDFISAHIYPIWSFENIDNAMNTTKKCYDLTKQQNPDKPIIITEAGWTTMCTGFEGECIRAEDANEFAQKEYYEKFSKWCKEENIMGFLFEAFDEPWKGSENFKEPEKHWGVFDKDRIPKLVMKEIYEKVSMFGNSSNSTNIDGIEVLKSSAPIAQQKDAVPRILTIDGGGSSAIASLMYLSKLEKEANKFDGKNKPLAERFDVIAGTSSGAIIAAVLATGLSATECENVFKSCLKEVFSNKIMRKIITCNGLISPIYDTKKLKKILEKYGIDDETKLSEFSGKARLCTVSFDTKTGKSIIHDSRDQNSNVTILEAVLASAAAPGYFAGRTNGEFDGGILNNNPTSLIWKKVCNSAPAYVVSVGSGRAPLPSFIDYNVGFKEIAQKLPAFVTANDVNTAHREMYEKSLGKAHLYYHRWDPELLRPVPIDASLKELRLLKDQVGYSLQKENDSINEVAKDLVNGTELCFERKLFNCDVRNQNEAFSINQANNKKNSEGTMLSVKRWIEFSESFHKSPHIQKDSFARFINSPQVVHNLCEYAKVVEKINTQDLASRFYQFAEKLQKWDSTCDGIIGNENKYINVVKSHQQLNNVIINPIQVLSELNQSYNHSNFPEKIRMDYASWLFNNEYNCQIFESLLGKESGSLNEIWRSSKECVDNMKIKSVGEPFREYLKDNFVKNLQYLKELSQNRSLNYKSNTGLEEYFYDTSSAKNWSTVAKTQNAEVKISEQLMGESFGEHIYYITQKHALKNTIPQKQFSLPYILKDSVGSPCVGYLNIPSDDYSKKDNNTQNTLEEMAYRHIGTREVVGKAVKGYVCASIPVIERRKENDIRILLAGNGDTTEGKEILSLDFVLDKDNIDFTMQNAFGENLISKNGVVKKSGENFIEISYKIWSDELETSKNVVVRTQALKCENKTIDPLNKESIQAIMDEFKPHVLLNIGTVPNNKFHRIETKAGDGKLSMIGSYHHDPYKTQKDQLVENRTCEKAIKNELIAKPHIVWKVRENAKIIPIYSIEV